MVLTLRGTHPTWDLQSKYNTLPTITNMGQLDTEKKPQVVQLIISKNRKDANQMVQLIIETRQTLLTSSFHEFVVFLRNTCDRLEDCRHRYLITVHFSYATSIQKTMLLDKYKQMHHQHNLFTL